MAATPAAKANDGELAAWLARYEPVEREIIEAHERRLANRARPNAEAARDFADLCEATEGLSVVWRRRWCAGRTATCSPCSVAISVIIEGSGNMRLTACCIG